MRTCSGAGYLPKALHARGLTQSRACHCKNCSTTRNFSVQYRSTDRLMVNVSRRLETMLGTDQLQVTPPLPPKFALNPPSRPAFPRAAAAMMKPVWLLSRTLVGALGEASKVVFFFGACNEPHDGGKIRVEDAFDHLST